MPTLYIDIDEWYPVHTLEENSASFRAPIELSDDEIGDYERVMYEFSMWQTRLENVRDSWGVTYESVPSLLPCKLNEE